MSPFKAGEYVRLSFPELALKQNMDFGGFVTDEGLLILDELPAGVWDIGLLSTTGFASFLPDVKIPGSMRVAQMKKAITLEIHVPHNEQAVAQNLYEAGGFHLAHTKEEIPIPRTSVFNVFWPGTWTMSITYQNGEVHSNTLTLEEGETGEMTIPGPKRP